MAPIGVSFQEDQFFSAISIPDAGRAIVAAGQDPFFILAPRRLIELSGVSFQANQFGAGFGIPDAGCAIEAAGQGMAVDLANVPKENVNSSDVFSLFIFISST